MPTYLDIKYHRRKITPFFDLNVKTEMMARDQVTQSSGANSSKTLRICNYGQILIVAFNFN